MCIIQNENNEAYSRLFICHTLHYFIAVGFKPFFTLHIVGKNPCNLIPETLGVVHLSAVAQLMHHNIIDYLRGSEHEKTVEIKVSLAAAASPACALVSYGYTSVGDADKWSEVCDPVRDICDSSVRKLFYLCI